MSAIINRRYLQALITADLDLRKMVFIGGPGQVGKTTPALISLEQSLRDTQHESYGDSPSVEVSRAHGSIQRKLPDSIRSSILRT